METCGTDAEPTGVSALRERAGARSVKTLLVALLAAGALIGGGTSPTVRAAGPAHHDIDGIPHNPQAPHLTTSATKPKTDGFNCGVSALLTCTSYETTINQFFTDVAAASGSADNVYSVMKQYYQDPGKRHITYSATFGGSYLDGNSFPAGGCNDRQDTFCVTDAQIQTEIEKAIAANHWPTASTDQFFIFTPADVGVCEFAAVNFFRSCDASKCSVLCRNAASRPPRDTRRERRRLDDQHTQPRADRVEHRSVRHRLVLERREPR